MRALGTTPLACLVALLFLAGCLGGASGPSGGPNDPKSLGGPGRGGVSYPRGEHPYPNGDEWPQGLDGPFERLSITDIRIPSHDGVELDGWIYRPKVPDGVKVPVVLWSSPYWGQTEQPGNTEAIARSSTVPVNLLVSKGYAVAIFSVRGTGQSGGCFEMFGPKEQKDQAHLVEWLGGQTWSNGRVGMMGLSYHGTTPWEAAINNPPSLKTIVVAGLVSDLYTFFHTPQGAVFTIGPGFGAAYTGLVSILPPAFNLPGSSSARYLPSIPARFCPEVVQMSATLHQGLATDARDTKFWADRRLVERFPQITSSVFLTHGFQDNHGSGHQQQEDWVWDSLTAPKRWLEGQWGHQFPNSNSFRSEWAMTDWYERLLPWLDFWLKGIGPSPPFVGVVDYQDGNGEWHTSTRWPPKEAHAEVMHLSGAKLAPDPASGPATFRSAPLPNGVAGVLCPNQAVRASPQPPGLVFATEPATAPVHVAGNAFAYVSIRSDLPGGLIAAHLYKLSSSFSCGNNGPTGARNLVEGVADLRFHAGNVEGKNFPTGTDAWIRIDISSLSEVFGPGERLALILSFGNPSDRIGQPYYPTITLNPGSHLVVPIVGDGFGGSAPTATYPPRPFLPPGVSQL